MSAYDEDAEVFLTINPECLIDEKWKCKDLRKLCKLLGIRSSGTREDLTARITAWHKGKRSIVDSGSEILNPNAKSVNLHLLPVGIVGEQEYKSRVKTLVRLDTQKLQFNNNLPFPTPECHLKEDSEDISPLKVSPTLLNPLKSSLRLESAIKDKKSSFVEINDENVRPSELPSTPVRKGTKSSTAMTSPPKSILKTRKSIVNFSDIKQSHHLTFSPFNSVRMIPHRSTFVGDELYKCQWGWPFFNYNPPDPLEELEYDQDESSCNYYDCVDHSEEEEEEDVYVEPEAVEEEEEEYHDTHDNSSLGSLKKRIRCSLDSILSNQGNSKQQQQEEEETSISKTKKQTSMVPALQIGVSLFPEDENDDLSELMSINDLQIAPVLVVKQQQPAQQPHRYNTRSRAKSGK